MLNLPSNMDPIENFEIDFAYWRAGHAARGWCLHVETVGLSLLRAKEMPKRMRTG